MQYYLIGNFILNYLFVCFQWNAQKSLCDGYNFILIHSLLFLFQ